MTETCDVVIVGGGIIGASIGFHLKAADPTCDVLVLDAAEMPGAGATSKATGGFRQQFDLPENVELSRRSLEAFRNFDDEHGVDIGFREHGYMFVTADPVAWERQEQAVALQNALGVESRSVPVEAATELFGELKADDLVGVAFCDSDGSADPSAALNGYLASLRRLGGKIKFGSPVGGLVLSGDRAIGVETVHGTIHAEHVVLASGANVTRHAASVGVVIPTESFQRQVFVVSDDGSTAPNLPMLVDLDTGWYVHQSASGQMVFGGTDSDSRPGSEPKVDWDGLDLVIEAASRRIPSIADRVRVNSAYAGIRTLTPDRIPIAGPTNINGMWAVSACNGHGFMHSPAIGELLASQILTAEADELGLRISPSRFEHGVPERASVTF